MMPQTRLLCAPSDCDNPFGEGIHHRDLIQGLRRANPLLWVPLPEHYKWWYPGKLAGMTCLWLGQPSKPGSVKICAFHMGLIPEFTQFNPDGTVAARGWRSILEKVVLARAASRITLEHIFRTTLTYGDSERTCPRCRDENHIVHTDTASGLCEWHDNASKTAKVDRQRTSDAPTAAADMGSHERRQPHSINYSFKEPTCR